LTFPLRKKKHVRKGVRPKRSSRVKKKEKGGGWNTFLVLQGKQFGKVSARCGGGVNDG